MAKNKSGSANKQKSNAQPPTGKSDFNGEMSKDKANDKK